jgi:4-amino-4-deoxy-L-arabinose transferase-like glycosyltransferase
MKRDLCVWWVAAVSLATRLAVAAWGWSRIPASADGHYYHRLATRLAAGEGYTWLWPDGAVTFAAHYPVGYPALLAGPYMLLGASAGVAMLVNAVVGTLGCVAVVAVLRRTTGPRAAWLGGMAAALHPGLVGYTAAVMTEGAVAALWAITLWAVVVARDEKGKTRARWLATAAIVLGIATLVRPQSLLLAPVLGAVAWPRRRVMAGLATAALTLAVCLPWTARNCDRMGQCALVSVNGGWNLLIGTDPAGAGGWSPLKVPEECRTVFDEAEKDACFGRAARRRIAEEPGAWLAMVPAKLGVTFDYCGAPGWYLHEANSDAFDAEAKTALGIAETVYERLLLLLALVAAWLRSPLRRRAGLAPLGVATVAALSPYGWLAWLALVGLLLGRVRGPVPTFAAAAVASVAAVHGAFFGAGRYQLVLALVVVVLAAPGARVAARWARLQLGRQLRRSRR